MLVIVTCIKTWHRFFEGVKHTVAISTDHTNLEYFMTTETYNKRQASWTEELVELDFTIIYRRASKGEELDYVNVSEAESTIKGGG